MDETGAVLHAAFVGAFRPYLKAKVAERGLPDLDESVYEDAGATLDAALRALLEQPYSSQRRSPLELVQEAVAGPTAALAAAGEKPVLRDPVTVAALPGDTYGLAPASSAELGEDAFHAHLAWGAAKAAALAPLVSGERRPVALLSADLIDRSRFEDAVVGAGLELVAWDPEGPRPIVAFIDLTHPSADEALQDLSGRTVRTVAYGPHVDDDAMARAAMLGASHVLPRSRLFRTISEHLPQRA